MVKVTKSKLSKLLAIPLILILVDVAFQTNAADPLNPIKFWILGFGGMWSLSYLATIRNFQNFLRVNKIYRNFILILSSLVIFNLISFIFTPAKSVGFIGDTGRNIGLLNYIFLCTLIIYASFIINAKNFKSLYWTSYILLLISTVYGILQHFNKDFLPWKNQYNPIILMTGNPDFAASLLGLLVVLSFAGLLINLSKFIKLFFSILILLAILVIYWTRAWQGLIATIIGIGLILFILTWQKYKKLSYALLALEISIGIISVLGMLQKGPFEKYLYKLSITDRGYNWRAAIEMVKHHPFTGVGLDRYAAYFLQYRDSKYPLIFGYQQTVTNAHNVFLQIFATAGIFAGLAYVTLILFIGWRALIAIKNSAGNDQIAISGIVAGWLVFVAQSFISVDSLVISIWGWILGGAIVALSARNGEVIEPRKEENPFKRNVTLVALSLLFLSVVVPMYRNETDVRRFTQIANPVGTDAKKAYINIARQTFNHPLLNPNYKVNIALKLAEYGYGPESIELFKATIKADPRNTNAYSLLAVVYEKLKKYDEAILPRLKLKELDPYGAENLYMLANDYLALGDKTSAMKVRDQITEMAPGTDVAKRSEKLVSN